MKETVLARFPLPMVQACREALDAKIFYVQQFADFVLARMGGFGCEATLIEVVDLPATGDGAWARAKELRHQAAEKVTRSPRGSYVVLRREIHPEGEVQFQVMISDGSGVKPSVGGSHDIYGAMPEPAQVLRRMFEYEVYSCQKVLESEREDEAARDALLKYGLKVGMRVKGLEYGGKPYSSGVITGINSEGTVHLELTRKGSIKRWLASLPAHELAHRARLDSAQQESGGSTPSVDQHTLPLFP